MPLLIVTTRDGEELQLEAATQTSVMENLRDKGVGDIAALCGGCCSCATCHVYVDPQFSDKVQPISPDESDLLDSSSHRKPTSRLSCQILFTNELDGLRVTVAPED